MRGLGVSFLVRRARSSWLLLACVTVTVLLTTALTAALWTFAAEVVPAGVLRTLAAPQARSVALSELADAGKAASDAQVIRATLDKAWPGISYQMDSALWAAPLQLPSSAATLPSSCPSPTHPGLGLQLCAATAANAQVLPASLEGITAQATLTAGKWPGPPGPDGPLPAALPAAVASQLHLTVGSVLKGTAQAAGGPSALLVTGLFRPLNPASAYWGLDLLPSSGVSIQGSSASYAGIITQGSTASYGPAVVNPAAFGGTLTAAQASWLVLPSAPPMARGNIAALAVSTSQAAARLAVAVLPYGLKVTSGLPQLLNGVASTIVLTRSLFAIAALQLLLVAGAELVLAARLLASQREEESALLRARGATRWQVARPALAEALALGALAGVAGVLAGPHLAGALARWVNLRLNGYPGGGGTPLAWLSALPVLALCAAVMTWPALRALTPNAARLRRGRQARLAGIAWAGGDLAVLALAAVAVWQLRGYSAVARQGPGTLGIDPVVTVAPALALAAVAIIPLRGLPLLAQLADKTTDHQRRLATAIVSWQIARRPIRQAGPALLVVIVTATTTLALAGYSSWRQSAADQAAFAVGADVRADSAGGVPPAAAGLVTRAAGVTAATAASVVAANGSQVIAVNASTAGQTILLRPDLSPLPLSTLWERIAPAAPSGLALPGEPARLQVIATLGAGLHRSAATVRELGSATVQAYFQDADGNTDELGAGAPLPFDGQPHPLVFTLYGPGQASYPLRLLGFTLTYLLPPYDPGNAGYAPVAALTVGSLAVAATAGGPFGPPFGSGTALSSWNGTGASTKVPTGPPAIAGGPLPLADGQLPAILGWRAAAGGRQLTFYVGHQPSLPVMLGVNLGPNTAAAAVALAAPPPTQVVPAIATSGYLAASHLGVGSTTAVSLGGLRVPVRIVASVTGFPSVPGPGRALIIDLAEVNDLLAYSQAPPLPVTRWWLRTDGGQVPHLPASLALTVTSRASQQSNLLDNQLLTGPRQAMVGIGLAAVLLGVLGFSISVAASLRSRRTQSAVFAALGVGKNAQAGQLCLEQCAVSLPAAAVGLLAGLGLAKVLVPAITVTAGAAQPMPPALVIVPIGTAAGLALVTAAGPAVAATLSVLYRPGPAAQLRAEGR